MDIIEKALRTTGVRGCLCYGLSDRYGNSKEGLEENIRFIKKIKARQAKGDDLVSAVFGLSGAKCMTTVIGGRVLMEDGKRLHLNEANINAESRKQAKSFWKRF